MSAIRAALGVLVLAALSATARAQEIEEYTVREGETCATIAERVYGSPRRYDRIHAHNPELGALPHRLRAGMVLHLPMPHEAGSDATVTDARGTVQRQLPSEPRWSGAHVGDELRSGARVSTGARSSAELTFRSSSVAAIRAETLVIVHGGSVERVREEGSRAVLREGSMLSRLSSLSGGATPLVVETPSAEVRVSEGETAVRVGADGATGISTLSGRAAVVRASGSTDSVEVPAGHGTHVSRGARPAPPRPLPAPPTWTSSERAFLGLAPTVTSLGGGTVHGAWSAVDAAASYHVEIARREDGRDLVFAATVPSTVTRFEAHGLPPGRYHVRVATIDAQHLEGRPPTPITLEVVGVRFLAPGEVAPPPVPDDPLERLESLDSLVDRALALTEPPPRSALLVGTRVLPAEGVVCAAGAGVPAHEIVLSEVGAPYLTCVGAEGANIVGLQLEVVSLRARVLDASGLEIGVLPRDASTDVRVLLDAGEIDRAALVLRADGGVAASPSLGDDGAWSTTLTPTRDASGPLTLSFAQASAPGVTLGSITLRVEDPPPVVVEPPPPVEAPRRLALHEGLGLMAMPSWVGLRDEQRTGIGATLGLLVASARLGEPEPRVRFVAGATAGLFDDYLRISATAPLDVMGHAARSADRGARDVYFSLGSRLLAAGAEGIGLALEAGVWAPTAGQLGLDHGRLMIAADVSLRLAERVTLRSRQAGLFDLIASGSLLWASAYGLDVAIVGPLSVGVEGTMTIGQEGGRDWYAGGVGLGVGIDVAPVVLSIAGRYGFGDDLWPTATVTASARASFDP